MPKHASKKNLYDTYAMHHPKGDFMCYMDEKRAFWYVNKDLAEWFGNKKIKLKFEPKGVGKRDSKFFSQKIDCKCVACGSEKELNKHHVVPQVFRSKLPSKYKDNNHYDVLILCIECHEKYEAEAMQLKLKLANDCGITINRKMTNEERENKKIENARLTLKKYKEGVYNVNGKNLIPEFRIKEIEEIASKELYKTNDVSMQKANEWSSIILNNYKDDKIHEFIMLWRQHFIDILNPKYLPEHWNIDEKIEISI